VWSIETFGLSKCYGEIASLTDCNLQVRQGSIFGLLGPNGAGKSTLIRTLMGLIRPTRGRATVCDFDVVKQSLQVRRLVSYLPADARLYRAMRGKDILKLFAGLHQFGDLARSQEIAERLELDTSRRVMFMSTGMRQKLAISVVLGSDAPLVVMDEPTANLDPNVRRDVLQLLRETRDRGNTVVLSSHIFSDIDEACDEVAILRKGRLVASHNLRSIAQLHVVSLRPIQGELRLPVVGSPSFVEFVEHSSSQCRLHLAGPPQTWLVWLAEQPFEVLSLEKAGVKAIYDRYHVTQAAEATAAVGGPP
jgi:ABC-2 type transport system ATP-binding protein